MVFFASRSRAGTHWRIVLWYVFFKILNSSSRLLHPLKTEVSSSPIWRRHAPTVAIVFGERTTSPFDAFDGIPRFLGGP